MPATPAYTAGKHAHATGAAIDTNPYITNPNFEMWRLGWVDAASGNTAEPSYARALGKDVPFTPPPAMPAPYISPHPARNPFDTELATGFETSTMAGAASVTGADTVAALPESMPATGGTSTAPPRKL